MSNVIEEINYLERLGQLMQELFSVDGFSKIAANVVPQGDDSGDALIIEVTDYVNILVDYSQASDDLFYYTLLNGSIKDEVNLGTNIDEICEYISHEIEVALGLPHDWYLQNYDVIESYKIHYHL